MSYPDSPLPEYRDKSSQVSSERARIRDPHKIDLKLCVAALKRLAEEPLGYEALRKHIIKVSGSTGKANRAIRDLVKNNWIEKTGLPLSRAPYRITEKGKMFLRSVQ